ncbi:glycosyltransferase family 39 protein [Leptolyngbya sp. FACHB-261]|uniref:ArnT family glycosyltransferase n=1 Tax=Leptolyngbya sp. FACHB-261 TaxID=2692806 RepID=UPI0016838B9E|nr:glycosyltransferase family 39 protein [Leptolyngbya sp. FACHB-261]MBD2103625.1 glycosyltransferase family 39 protein [Leptolyngbya sp. FACHB-261]
MTSPRQQTRPEIWLLVGIFLGSLLLRVLASQVPINVDEVKWMHRGLGFLGELVDRNLAGTYFQHHPGVTTMWLNGISLMAHCLLREWFPTALQLDQTGSLQACAQLLKAAPALPVESYVLVRVAQAVITSACMVFLYVLARQLLGQTVALLALVLLNLEPFFLSYQRLLTTDAFQTDFTILALLLLLLYLRGNGDRRPLVGSGVFMGLAAATKTPSLAVLPAITAWLVLIEVGAWRRSFPQRGWLRQALDLALWGVVIVATVFVIWPALWVAPIQTVTQLLSDLQSETERGYLFFWGQVTESPGPLFYPVLLAYRLSPVLELGLVFCLIALLTPRLRRSLSQVPEYLALALVPCFILLVFSAIDSKIDRYVMPMLPFLALLSAVGWQQASQWLTPWTKPLWEGRGSLLAKGFHSQTSSLVLVLLLAQLAVVLPHYPYYLTYYNPLLGGAPVAQRLLMLGNGEGLDLAASWLNQQPNAKTITAASWYLPSFAPYFQGKSVEINKLVTAGKNNFVNQPRWWEKVQRIVLYINQHQRQLPDPKILAYFAAQQPLHTVQLHGVDYAQIYSGPAVLPEEEASLANTQAVTFGEQVRLLGHKVESPQVRNGSDLVVTLYWQFLEPVPADTAIVLSLQDTKGVPRDRSTAPPLAGLLPLEQIAPGTVLRDSQRLSVPSDTPIGRYRLQVGWTVAGRDLTIQNGSDQTQRDQAILGEIEVTPS